MRTVGILKTDEEIIKIVEENGYELIKYRFEDAYRKRRGKLRKDRSRKITIKDNNGYYYDTTTYAIQNHKIDFVNKNNPYSLKNIDRWLFLNNKKFKLKKGNIYSGSHPPLIFNCYICHDEFKMAWSHIITGHECSVCGGQQVGNHHSLYELRPDLMEEWNYKLNKISPKEITINSSYHAHWICKNGYGKWESDVYKRTYSGHRCPYCDGNWLSDLNRLSIINPELSKEWNKIKNKNLTPKDVSHGSRVRVWWKCSICKHEYKSPVAERSSGRGCPKCSLSGNEQEIIKILKVFNFKMTRDYITGKNFSDCKYMNTLPFDFYFKKINLIIEFHGEQHYKIVNFGGKSKEKAEKEFEIIKIRDKIKEDYCNKNNHNLIIIPYWDFKNLKKIINDSIKISERR